MQNIMATNEVAQRHIRQELDLDGQDSGPASLHRGVSPLTPRSGVIPDLIGNPGLIPLDIFPNPGFPPSRE